MKRRNIMALGAAVAGLAADPALAAEGEREAAIRRTAMDYIEGWYTGDAARMERSLHPELAKRVMMKGPDGRRRLQQMSAMTLTQSTRQRPAKEDKTSRRELRILDIFQGTASVRLDAEGWIDYMHLVETDDGRWLIVNVLWDLRQ
ncbi:nuclear transport factor 2 family protein [Pelomonas sp. SE-A7]|uniref:nuclear transport factor 2 family protein n=1 Tax=Pelomonas sp. SE-A7 TaxID=3054953 RepID=UPI00259D01F1|nr:nuclear transport factor 2 family protein [Pelomonas sp. SE-A7]MDM4766492.1 nuclear transport factor 2 family protein [Pelomonas sp. SE-A7]